MILEKIVRLEKPQIFQGDISQLFGLEQIGVYIKGTPLTRYTDGNIIYDIEIYNTGDMECKRIDIDDYIMVSDTVTVIAVPVFQADKATKEALIELDEFKRSVDFIRNEANGEDLKRFKILIEKHQDSLVPIDFDYLAKKGISTDRNSIKFEVRPLAPDLITGLTAYTIVAIAHDIKNPKGKYIYSLKQRKMPYKLWSKIKPYMNYYTERNDNFDPMHEIEKGIYYTFQEGKVKKILEEYNND